MYILKQFDLEHEYSVSIGSDFELILKFCDNPDFTEYTGVSDVRDTKNSNALILQITIEVVDKNTLKLSIPNNIYPSGMTSNTYNYDVLMTNTTNGTKLYVLAGKIAFIKRITE